jgi:hypothetical protein
VQKGHRPRCPAFFGPRGRGTSRPDGVRGGPCDSAKIREGYRPRTRPDADRKHAVAPGWADVAACPKLGATPGGGTVPSARPCGGSRRSTGSPSSAPENTWPVIARREERSPLRPIFFLTLGTRSLPAWQMCHGALIWQWRRRTRSPVPHAFTDREERVAPLAALPHPHRWHAHHPYAQDRQVPMVLGEHLT